MTATLIDSGDEHHWVLLDHRVTQLLVDPSSFRFQTWSLDASAEIRCSVPFRLRQRSGAERVIDPAATETLAPVLSLLRRRIESLTITRRGELTVHFGAGLALIVEPHPRHEAWEVQGGGALEGMQYRCDVGAGAAW